MALTDKEKNYEQSRGFLEEWLKTAPGQVQEHLQNLANGLVFYRDRVSDIAEDLTVLRQRYTDLTALSANYLEVINRYQAVNEAVEVVTEAREQVGSQS